MNSERERERERKTPVSINEMLTFIKKNILKKSPKIFKNDDDIYLFIIRVGLKM